MEKETLLDEKKQMALWIAHSLFERGKTSGSSANMSFLHQGKIYITGTGTCFGTLREEEFSCLSMDGAEQNNVKPSKEWPLHALVYRNNGSVQAVIHTHSTYSVLWSFLDAADEKDCIPPNTPYLAMRVGRVGLIPYEKPGSRELFEAFDKNMSGSEAWILRRHGPVVPGRTLLDAFYNLEELEESARVAWELRKGLPGN